MSPKISIFSIIVLVCVAVIATSVDGYVRDLNRPNSCSAHYWWGSSLFGRRCCLGEYYDFAHLKEFMKECSVTPKDASMSIADSNWLVFECLISKAVESKPITWTNFGQAMTTNMSEETRTLLLSRLGQESVTTEIPNDKSEKDKATLVQEFWTKYFEIEVKVCRNESSSSKNTTSTLDYWYTRYWAPSTRCGNQSHPYIPTHMTYWIHHVDNSTEICRDALLAKHNFKNYTDTEKYAVRMTCALADSGVVKIEDLYETNKFDYKAAAMGLMPKFWSTEVKERGIKFAFRQSIFWGTSLNMTDTFEENMARVRTAAQNELYSYNGGNHAETEELFTNIFMLRRLRGNSYFLEYQLCRDNRDYI